MAISPVKADETRVDTFSLVLTDPSSGLYTSYDFTVEVGDIEPEFENTVPKSVDLIAGNEKIITLGRVLYGNSMEDV